MRSCRDEEIDRVFAFEKFISVILDHTIEKCESERQPGESLGGLAGVLQGYGWYAWHRAIRVSRFCLLWGKDEATDQVQRRLCAFMIIFFFMRAEWIGF